MDKFNQIAGSVFCSFITNLPDMYKIDSSALEIQTSSTNNDLSDLISQMVEIEGDKFDFLINGEFLRGNLKSHILKFEIQTEQILQITYFLSIKAPELEKEIDEDDWISSIQSSKNLIVTSLFSGAISVYKNQKKILTHQVSEKSLKALKFLDNKIYTGGLNNVIDIFELNKNQIENKFQLQGSKNSIECLDINPIDTSYVCGAGQDLNLYIWKVTEKPLDNDKVSKKVKKDANQIIQATVEYKLHNDTINCICWPSIDTIVTGSSDHSIKLFDVNKKMETTSFQLKDSICSSLDIKNDMIINGTESGAIKLWDIRQKDRNSQQTFKSHKVWVSEVKFHPKADNLFASTSYDQTIKIWDLRTTFPLFTLKANNKQFALDWQGDDFLLSGGQDQMISFHKFQQ